MTPEQEAEAEQIADVLMAAMRVDAKTIGRLLASKDNRNLFGQTEFQLRDILLDLGSRGLDAALSDRKKGGYTGSSVTCSCCKESAKFVGYRKTTLTCLFGKVTYERAYYHCAECGEGFFPTDAELDVKNRKTRAAEEIVSLAGVSDTFEEAAEKVLAKMSGLRVSKSTVQRTAEAVGNKLAEERAAGETVGPEFSWDWQCDAQGGRVAYVSLDATGVPQQGPDRKKAECRMAWVGCVFNPHSTHNDERRPLKDARYVAGLMSLPEIGSQIRRECQAVGVSQADVVVALTDGGAGLQDCLQDALAGQVKQTQFILDFFHVTEHVHDFAKTWMPRDEAARNARADDWCHTLKHEGGKALLAELEDLDLSKAGGEVVESHWLLTNYLRSNQHRTE